MLLIKFCVAQLVELVKLATYVPILVFLGLSDLVLYYYFMF